MDLFIVLGVVVLITFVVLGVLSVSLTKEEKKEKTISLKDFNQLKEKLSSQVFEENSAQVIEKDSEIIPIFTPKAPVQAQSDPSKSVAEKRPSLEDEIYKKRAQKLEEELLAVSQKADGESDEAKQTIETLTKENESLKSEKANLEYELIKARAQTSALERVSSNYKIQLEELKARIPKDTQV